MTKKPKTAVETIDEMAVRIIDEMPSSTASTPLTTEDIREATKDVPQGPPCVICGQRLPPCDAFAFLSDGLPWPIHYYHTWVEANA